ncbi:MAG: hypothetical protein GWP05_04030 [Anaerolineaceae bacterium]|nr:hypothetical protein [Anaerolineaceae bacterium]
MVEMYRLMGTAEQQIRQIQQYGFLQARNMLLLMALSALPLFGYLLYVKKYFRPRT